MAGDFRGRVRMAAMRLFDHAIVSLRLQREAMEEIAAT